MAPSTIAPTEICSGSEALATISHLKARVERLEESIGRLLLEKEAREPEEYKGGNCCMSYTDASKTMEQGMSAAGGNCCITFRSSRINDQDWERQKFKLRFVGAILIVFIFCMMLVLIPLTKNAHPSLPRDD